jgi:ubiquitin carboxyl-terminal hydrolase 14
MTVPVPLVIKWNKETVNLSFVPEAGVKSLKSDLEDVTGVPADRMKIMAKSKGLWKGVLKDEENLSSIDWDAAASKAGPGGLQLLLMGSATKLAAPKEKTVFLEDLPPAELAKVKEPSGLVNLGTGRVM